MKRITRAITMPSDNALTEATVLEIAHELRPETIDGLVQALIERVGSRRSDIVSLLHAMVRSRDLSIQGSSKSSWLGNFFAKHVFLKKILVDYARETLIKALAFIVIINLLSWGIILYFESSVILTWLRIAILGIALLFLPGFSLVIEWYPFRSRVLDFDRLKRENRSRAGKDGDGAKKNELDLLTRVGYSICYSLGLIVLLGFLIGLLNYGFNVVILNACFTAIEALVILDTLFKIKKLNDPFLAI